MKVFSFMNHASIQVNYNGYSLLTDPWFISNAFGSWHQEPSPLAEEVKNIIFDNSRSCVIVSHGHDDHLDEFFIKNHLKTSNAN
jgi:L-ascorbate metabolism protein UlaG (beta-lactamase superfamily)